MTRTKDRLTRLETTTSRSASVPVYLVDLGDRTSRPVDPKHQTIVLLPMKQECHPQEVITQTKPE